MTKRKSSKNELGEFESPEPTLVEVESAIVETRGERMILDADLAALYGVETKRLNEQVKRNADRFGDKYAFQLTKKEFDTLKSQSATSKSGRRGRRYPPWAFTEYGVVIGVERLSDLGGGIGGRLQLALNHVLDSVIDTKQKTTVREEAQNVISESIQHLKERLKKQGLENEETAASVTKLLAEAEKEKAIAAKTRAEAEKLEFATIVKKLRLLLEVQRAIEHEKVDDFLDVLREMGDD